MSEKSFASSPLIQTFNVRNHIDAELFDWQLRNYFTEMCGRAKAWRGPGNDQISLQALDESLYEKFGLTSQALRLLAQLENEERWNRGRKIEAAHGLAALHLGALDGKLDINATDFQEVFAHDSRIGMVLSVTSDPAARILKSGDLAGWTLLLSRTHPGMRVVDDRAAKAKKRKAQRFHAIRLTDSQHELAKTLESFWSLKQKGIRLAGYDLRPIPLIVGPSGSGKSALARHFSESNRLAMQDFNVGTWVITGAKAS